MQRLITLAELADLFQIPVEELEVLRRRHRWPHVKMGRKNVRFTPEQVDLIIRQHTVDQSHEADGGVVPTPRSQAYWRRQR